MSVREHKAVFHSTCVYGRMNIRHGTCANTAAGAVRYAQVDCRLAIETALRSSAGMLLLRLFKRRRPIALSMDPHRKDNPRPHTRKCPHCDGMASSLWSFAVVVV